MIIICHFFYTFYRITLYACIPSLVIPLFCISSLFFWSYLTLSSYPKRGYDCCCNTYYVLLFSISFVIGLNLHTYSSIEEQTTRTTRCVQLITNVPSAPPSFDQYQHFPGVRYDCCCFVVYIDAMTLVYTLLTYLSVGV